MPRYAHVIWDWNGTIFDDAERCVEIANGMLSRRELPVLSLDQYRETFRFPIRD